MNLWKIIAPVVLVACLSGCGKHCERLKQLPNGQYRIDSVSNGVLTKTRVYDANGQLISESRPWTLTEWNY
jgi:hypothetical protein